MAIELKSRWDEDPRTTRGIALAGLHLAGSLLRFVTFSIFALLAPFIRLGLAIAAFGGFLVILLALVRPHRHPFPYGMIAIFSSLWAVLYTLFDRLLRALEP